MKTLLPKHLKELCIIDEILGEFVNSKLDFTDRFFYTPNVKNTSLIAQTFDIDISNINENKAQKLLNTPMLSKSTLGTKKALRSAISKIMGDVIIQTAQEDKKLKPFEFSLRVNIDDGIDESTLKSINNIVYENKPVRDNLAGLDFDLPKQEYKIKFKTSIQWRL